MESCSKRQCERCETNKPVTEFYQKQGRIEGEVRWEKICKCCKRLDRKKRYEQSKSSVESLDQVDLSPRSIQPKEIIEPKTISQNEPEGPIELEKNALNRSIDATDFSMWERICGRNITEEEKIEIASRLGGFFKLLISEKKNRIKL